MPAFLEMARRYGPDQITGLARLAGQSVGVFTNDARQNAGSLTAADAQKLGRFVDLCGLFHLPIVTLVDEPGFMIGLEVEAAATIRHGVAALATVALSTVPWASVVIRKAMGLCGYVHRPPGTVSIDLAIGRKRRVACRGRRSDCVQARDRSSS
jgi:acetyl-CoA carboxylase carboxyltransferase component